MLPLCGDKPVVTMPCQSRCLWRAAPASGSSLWNLYEGMGPGAHTSPLWWGPEAWSGWERPSCPRTTTRSERFFTSLLKES